MKEQRRVRVLIAKIGLDGHDRGALVLSVALRDAGMEVIYTGLHRNPPEVAETAVQEDVDIVGISSMADAHNVLAPKVVEELNARGRGDIPVILGGFIQPEDFSALKEKGIAEVFGINTSAEVVIGHIQNLCGGKR